MAKKNWNSFPEPNKQKKITPVSYTEEIKEKPSKPTFQTPRKQSDAFAPVAAHGETSPSASVFDAPDFSAYSGVDSTVTDARYRYINDPQYRTAYDRLIEIGSTGAVAKNNFQEAGLVYMTEKERSAYNYYYRKFGKNKADAYLSTIAGDLNARHAGKIVADTTVEGQPVLSNILKLKQGFDTGIDSWQQNMRHSSDLLHGNDHYVAPTAQQIASGEIRSQMADQGLVSQVAYDVATSTGQMLPSMMTSALADVILPGSGKLLGAGMMGMSSAGGAYQDAINRGYTPDQARGYGILTGASEASLGYILSGITKLGGKVTGPMIKKLTGKVNNALLKVAVQYGGEMLSEFGEEYLQSVLSKGFENLTLGTEHDIDLLSEEAIYDGMVGAVNSLLLNGAGGVFSKTNDVPDAQTLAEQNLMFKTQTGKTEGVDFDRKGRAFDPVREASFRVMDSVARHTGKQFHVYESYVNQEGQRVYRNSEGQEVTAPNGIYKDGEIYVDLNAGETGRGTMLFTAAHELTHFIRDKSPDQFNALADVVLEIHGENKETLIQKQQEKALQNGQELTREDAMEEIIADSMESMLKSGNVPQLLAKLHRQNLPLWQKVTSWLKDTTANLNSAVDVYRNISPENPEGKAIAEMKDTTGELENIYAQALVDAGKSFRSTVCEKQNEKHSLRIVHADGKVEELLDARSITDQEIVNYLSLAKSSKLYDHSYIPIRKDTPQVLIDTLAQVNEPIKNLSMIMQVAKARQSMADTKKDRRKPKYGSNVRNHALRPEEIVSVINNLDNPNTIIYQTERTDKYGNPLPNNISVFVNYDTGGKEGVAVVEFESSIDPKYIGKEQGETQYHTVVTAFEPDTERNGYPFDYAEELLRNPNNYELTIERRLPTKNANRENRPNIQSKSPSKPMIPQANVEFKQKNSLRNQTTVPEQLVRWVQETEAARRVYGNFDLSEELREPVFARLLAAGIPVGDAYLAVHQKEILEKLRRVARQQGEKQLSRRLEENRRRPRENGLNTGAAFLTKPNVSAMTKADRQEIARRAAKGERIVF